jgi:hypothetical protein
METIQAVIRPAEDRRLEEAAEAASNPSGSVLGADFLERMAKGGDKKHIALYKLVGSLPDDQKDEMLALMWLGRAGAGETVEMWSDLLAAARNEDEPGKTAAIAGKSPLGTYLSAGLDRLGE